MMHKLLLISITLLFSGCLSNPPPKPNRNIMWPTNSITSIEEINKKITKDKADVL